MRWIQRVLSYSVSSNIIEDTLWKVWWLDLMLLEYYARVMASLDVPCIIGLPQIQFLDDLDLVSLRLPPSEEKLGER